MRLTIVPTALDQEKVYTMNYGYRFDIPMKNKLQYSIFESWMIWLNFAGLKRLSISIFDLRAAE